MSLLNKPYSLGGITVEEFNLYAFGGITVEPESIETVVANSYPFGTELNKFVDLYSFPSESNSFLESFPFPTELFELNKSSSLGGIIVEEVNLYPFGSILVENEVTRQTALHCFATIANSPLNLDLTKCSNELVLSMSSFLKNHDNH